MLGLLALVIFSLAAQIELVRRDYDFFPRPSSMKICPECDEKVSVGVEECSVCGTLIADPDQYEDNESENVPGLVESELEEKIADEDADQKDEEVDSWKEEIEKL
ncbi:MAG: hypothetical protein ACOCTN_06865 [Candidatus Natronoplasma sp.]